MKQPAAIQKQTMLQTEWFDYWFKVPIVKCGNNELGQAIAKLKEQGCFVHTMMVKHGGYELHSRKN